MTMIPDHPLVGERVLTGERLTLPEEFEALRPLLTGKLGTVRSRDEYTITRTDGPDLQLKTATVELDDLPGHPLTFGVDELYAPHEPADFAPGAAA